MNESRHLLIRWEYKRTKKINVCIKKTKNGNENWFAKGKVFFSCFLLCFYPLIIVIIMIIAAFLFLRSFKSLIGTDYKRCVYFFPFSFFLKEKFRRVKKCAYVSTKLVWVLSTCLPLFNFIYIFIISFSFLFFIILYIF